MSLVDQIRSITGVADTIVADDMVNAALAANRVWIDEPVEWQTNRVGAARVWGVLESVELLDAYGDVLDQEEYGIVIDASGGVLLDAEGDYPALSIRGWGYDVYAASALVCDMAAASSAAAFDFTADGDSFSRSQTARGYGEAAQRFRRLALPRRVAAAPSRRDEDTLQRVTRRAGR